MRRQDKKQEAYDNFYRQSYRTIYRFCITRGQTHADADEIAGEALIRLYGKWDERWTLSDSENLKWLFNTAQYIIYEYGRTNNKNESDSLEGLTETPDSADAEKEALEREQYRFYINEIKKLLDGDEWELFNLAFIEGLTYAELRERLSVDKEVLRARLYRLRKKLKKRLKELFEEKNKNL